ncbi:hypothetical protein SAMN05660733_06308 [Lentzea albidocapillata]|uniref:Uncharacterized protein n=2 Tax=Lentzea albidocapillata TaxID=40571 RepID=A0A1W2FI46_9PSEU|nr:hypothetical protein SAMN05660733_06308 [Lentzea albidocapillata]
MRNGRGLLLVRMSLLVSVYLLDENGNRQFPETPAGCEELAGFESWRTEVWGNEAVRALGARFFPVLAENDLYVTPDQVPDFIRETKVLRANLASFAPQGVDERRTREWYLEGISSRLANIQIAAGWALGAGGGIVIW